MPGDRVRGDKIDDYVDDYDDDDHTEFKMWQGSLPHKNVVLINSKKYSLVVRIH